MIKIPDRIEELIRLLNCIGYRFNDYDAEECVANPKYMQRLAEYVSHTGSLSNVEITIRITPIITLKICLLLFLVCSYTALSYSIFIPARIKFETS